MSTAEMLQSLFEADTDAPDYYQTAPGFELNQELGWPPWFPPAHEAWAHAEPPETWHGPAGAWGDTRDRLERLHADYLTNAG